MVRVCALAVMLIAVVPAASAQPPKPLKPAAQENVTVTATKSRAVVETFTKAMATPTKLTGKIARWESGICPLAVGQQPALTTMVTQRVKDVAATVGAPVSSLESCTPNIEVIFTTTPQALLDNIRKHDPDYLGYAENSSEKQKLATVTRPIQAWYATETVDLDGRRTTDSARQVGTGFTLQNFSAHSLPTSMGVNRDPIDLPNASFARVTGNHINDGARSAFNHIIVIVDSSKLAGQKIGPLVDYIAMLSLTQLNALDTCQQLPSIVNAMTPDCDQRVEGMTNIDVAYLRGLYRMGSDKALIWQQNDIADQMTAALASPSALQPEMAHLAAPAQSGCVAPDTPATVDGGAITSDHLKASVMAARQFMALSDAYQDCLGKEINGQKAAATPDKAVTDRDLALVASNQRTKETIGASVNAAIAAYKKAHPAP